jgi:Tfp pilus assembly protein PilN
MRPVNLLPAPRVETRQDDGQSPARTTKAVAIAAGLTLAFVTATVGFTFVHERSAANDRRSTLDGLQAKIAQTHAATAASAPVATETQEHLAAITTAASGRTAWDRLLDQLSRVMPPGTSLETLQANDGTNTSPTSTSTSTSTSTTTSSSPASKLPSSPNGTAPATGAAPTGFVVTGNAGSQATVARALDRLALIPALSDVTLQSTKRADAAGKQALQFTIAATLRPTGGTPR